MARLRRATHRMLRRQLPAALPHERAHVTPPLGCPFRPSSGGCAETRSSRLQNHRRRPDPASVRRRHRRIRGTAFAAMRAMDTGPDAAALRAERAKQQQAHERRQRERKPASGRRRRPAAAAPAAPRRRLESGVAHGRPEPRPSAWTHGDSLVLLERYPENAAGDPPVARCGSKAVRPGDRADRSPRSGVRSKTARAADERALGILAADRRDVASLKKRWNDATVRRMIDRDRGDRAIVRLFRQLGAPDCADL